MKLKSCEMLPVLLLSLGGVLQSGCGSDDPGKVDEIHEMTHADVHSSIVRLDAHKIFHAGIKVERVDKKSLPVPLVLSGKLLHNEKELASITARIGGRVEKVLAYVNDAVRTGDTLLEVYSQDYQALQYEFVQARQRFDAAIRDSPENPGSAGTLYEAVRRKLVVTGATEEEIGRLERTGVPEIFYRVRAPFTGTILANEVRVGEMIESGDGLFEIANLALLWVLADIYERDISLLQSGMNATVEVLAYPELFPARISTVYNVVDPQSRTVKARLIVPNKEGKLKAGMFCTVNVQTAVGTETIKIPETALLGDTEDHFVFVAINDTTFEKRDIRTGAERREFVEVLDGLLEGERIVVKGGFFLKSELARETFGEEH